MSREFKTDLNEVSGWIGACENLNCLMGLQGKIAARIVELTSSPAVAEHAVTDATAAVEASKAVEPAKEPAKKSKPRASGKGKKKSK